MVRLDHRRPTRRQTGAVGSNQSWISTIIVICKSEFSGKIGVVNRVSVFIKRAEISHVHALAPDQTLCPTLEVLSQLPEATQHFLLHTSIAERLCAALCDAILSEGGARAGRGRGEGGARAGRGLGIQYLPYATNPRNTRTRQPLPHPIG